MHVHVHVLLASVSLGLAIDAACLLRPGVHVIIFTGASRHLELLRYT